MRSETPALQDDQWVVEPGFEPVVDAFLANFRHRGDLGAALAVYIGDKPLIDVWAGYRDRAGTLPWQRDTMAPVFSSTKGVSALVVASMVSRKLLAYDRPVAHDWDEFGAHNKQDITLRQLIDHEAGLPALDRPIRLSDLADLDAAAAILADQRPAWTPGTRHGYHPMTGGLYLRELVRRVDPHHRTLGQVFADDFAKPLGLDFYIGLPAPALMNRVAELSPTQGWKIPAYERDFAIGVVASMLNKRSITSRAMNSPQVDHPPHDLSRQSYLEQENPAAGGVGTARSLARIYSLAANPDSAYPNLPIDRDTLQQIGSRPLCAVPDWDLTLKNRSRYHLGMRKQCNRHFAIGSDERAFGTTGLGGSVGYGDPATGIGFGFVPSRLGWALVDDIRARTIRQALQQCLTA